MKTLTLHATIYKNGTLSNSGVPVRDAGDCLIIGRCEIPKDDLSIEVGRIEALHSDWIAVWDR